MMSLGLFQFEPAIQTGIQHFLEFDPYWGLNLRTSLPSALCAPAGRDRGKRGDREDGEYIVEDGENTAVTTRKRAKQRAKAKGREKGVRRGGRHGGLAGCQDRECAPDVPPPPGGGGGGGNVLS